MPHPYSNELGLRLYLSGKGPRYISLLDRDSDGIADSVTVGATTVTQLDAVLERAANDIDRDLGRIYSVPFASITPAAPTYAPTYGQVADLCNIRCAYLLWFFIDPEAPECEKALAEYDATVDDLRGDGVIPGAPLVDAGESRRSIAYESGGTEVAGQVTNGYRDASYAGVDSGQSWDPTKHL